MIIPKVNLDQRFYYECNYTCTGMYLELVETIWSLDIELIHVRSPSWSVDLLDVFITFSPKCSDLLCKTVRHGGYNQILHSNNSGPILTFSLTKDTPKGDCREVEGSTAAFVTVRNMCICVGVNST